MNKESSPTSVTVCPTDAARYLVVIGLILLAANMMAIFMRHFTDHNHVFGLVAYFNFDSEMNPSTLFSTCLFLINALLFELVYLAQCKYFSPERFWVFLSGLFVFLALDEFCAFHEHLILPLQDLLNAGGYLYFAWVIPYGFATFVLALFFMPVLKSLDQPIKIGFSLSAATYILGAIGFEMIGGNYLESLTLSHQKRNLTYDLMVTMEESLEMIGLILLTYTLISLIERLCGEFNIKIGCRHQY